MNEKARKIQTKVTAALKSSRGQNVLLYLLFVAVAFVFWVFCRSTPRCSAILMSPWNYRIFLTV